MRQSGQRLTHVGALRKTLHPTDELQANTIVLDALSLSGLVHLGHLSRVRSAATASTLGSSATGTISRRAVQLRDHALIHDLNHERLLLRARLHDVLEHVDAAVAQMTLFYGRQVGEHPQQ